MENIALFVITVFVYSTAWFLLESPAYWNISLSKWAKRVALVALIALPLNINGNVFTIAGNAKSEKSVYSIFSFYQNAGQDAVTIFGLAYQNAGQDAVTIFGLAYQNAGQNAVTFFGLAYQNAGQNAVTFFGLAYQNAGQDAVSGIGLTVQNAKEKARVPLAIALYQRVGEKTRAFGAFSSLTKD